MKTCITLYAYGDMRADCFPAHMELITSICQERRQVQWFTIREDALISRSRCRATAQFLATDCDVWLQLDHDISWEEPSDLWDLCALAIKHQAVVQIPYSKRVIPASLAHRPKPKFDLPVPGTDELTPITMFASGCVAIPRSVLEKTLSLCRTDAVPPDFRVRDCWDTFLNGTMPTLWHPMVLATGTDEKTGQPRLEYLSEDYSASARFTLADVPILAFSRPTLKHWGMHGYHLVPPPQPEPQLQIGVPPILAEEAPIVVPRMRHD